MYNLYIFFIQCYSAADFCFIAAFSLTATLNFDC